MDYKTLMQTVEGMNDEELYLAEKKISDERRRRHAKAQLASSAALSAGTARAVIDLAPLIYAVRDSLRVEMGAWSDASLSAVLDQTAEQPRDYSETAVLNSELQHGLTVAYVHEARCEAARRSDCALGNKRERQP